MEAPSGTCARDTTVPGHRWMATSPAASDTATLLSESGPMGPSRPIPLWLTLGVYVGTALIQPTLTDEIRYSGGAGQIGWPPTLLTTLANTVAMASLVILVGGQIRSAVRNWTTLRAILTCGVFDFSAGILLSTGLLMLGSGIFVVVYSSTTAWTAIIASCLGERLTAGRWAGVLLVSTGMIISASSNFLDAVGDAKATASLMVGCLASIGGTCMHAAMFVFSERAIHQVNATLHAQAAWRPPYGTRLGTRGSTAYAHAPTRMPRT